MRYANTRAKKGVCKGTGIAFCCCEEANNFKNISELFGVKITNFNTFYSIWVKYSLTLNHFPWVTTLYLSHKLEAAYVQNKLGFALVFSSVKIG